MRVVDQCDKRFTIAMRLALVFNGNYDSVLYIIFWKVIIAM